MAQDSTQSLSLAKSGRDLKLVRCFHHAVCLEPNCLCRERSRNSLITSAVYNSLCYAKERIILMNNALKSWFLFMHEEIMNSVKTSAYLLIQI
jgi:hypothetical protein